MGAEGETFGAWVIAPLDDDGSSFARAGCMRTRVADEMSPIGGVSGNGVAFYAGRIPDDAVEVRFDSGPPITIDDDGFFLIVLPGEFEARRTIEALDADGAVVSTAET